MSNPFDRVTKPTSQEEALKELMSIPKEEFNNALDGIDQAIAEMPDTATANALTAAKDLLLKVIKVVTP